MKNAIQFGAGNIGRGFIGMLLSQAGYRVVFADVNETIIDRLKADQGYTVHVMDTEVEDVPIRNVTGILSTGEEIVEEIAKADILTTAVGLRVLLHCTRNREGDSKAVCGRRPGAAEYHCM